MSDFPSPAFRGRDRAPAASAYDPADDVRAPAWEDAAAAAAAPVPLAPDGGPADGAPLAPEAVGGNLRRYARWQWRDFWQRRGFWLAGAALFGVWFLVRVALGDRWVGDPSVGPLTRKPPSRDEVLGISHVLFGIGGVLAGALGVGGLVSRERERGLQRFLFAKPVRIVRYYLQGFAVNGIGSLAVILGAVLLAAFTAGQAIPVATVFAVAAAGYLLSAGITFLLSTLIRFDAAAAVAWLVAGIPVVAFAENGQRWAQALQWLFPHGPAFAVLKALVPRNGVPGGLTAAGVEVGVALALLVGVAYGAACVLAGVAVLRRRSISA